MVEEYDLVLKNCRVKGKGERVTIAIKDRRIAQISESLVRGKEEIDVEGRLVLPAFMNMHTHLDSALTLGRPRYNESGTLWEGIRIWGELKRELTKEDILTRVEKVAKWCVATGTLWVRTNADCTLESLVTVKALLEAKNKLSELLDIQVTAFPQDGILTDPKHPELLEKALELGADNVGLIPHNEWTREEGVKSIEIAFELAKKYDRRIDGHIDETDDPSSRYLEVVASRAVKQGWIGKVAAGHVTASHSWDAAYRYRILDLLKRAGVTIVANPLVNVHLQGRFDQYPKRRGMAPLKQFAHNGVNVALGHDDIMDPWYPLGIGSMIQVLFMAVHLDQWTGINELSQSFELITHNASKCWGNEKEYGIEVGKRANLLVMNAKSELDVLREVGLPLYVVKDGTIVAKNLDRRFSEVLYNGRWEKLSFF